MTIEEHYQILAPKLTNWLVATGSSYSVACDLVQETFVKLWKMRDDRRMVFVEEIREEDAGTTSGAPPTASDDVAFLRNRLQKAFAELPPLLREAYTLFQVGELSIREIAHETGVSENLVKVRIHRAKEKLKVLLADLKAGF